MAFSRKIGLSLSIIFSTIIFDHVTKDIAQKTLKFMPPKIYLGDFFRLQYAENEGAMLGMGSDLSPELRFWFLTVFVGLLLAALIVYLLFSRGMGRVQVWAFSLIAGGGVSNFIDRLLNDGRVVDFMNMGIGWLRTGIFNVADVGIMVGLGLILTFGGMARKKHAARPEEKDETT